MRSELDRRVAGDRLKTSVEKVEEVEEAEEAERAQVNRGGSREGGGEEGGGGGGGGGIHGLGTYTHTHTHTDTHTHTWQVVSKLEILNKERKREPIRSAGWAWKEG